MSVKLHIECKTTHLMLCRLHTVNHCQWLYTVLHWTQCVKLYCKMVSFSRSVWKKLHRAEKIYTGSACGARNNYEVWVFLITFLLLLLSVPLVLGNHLHKEPSQQWRRGWEGEELSKCDLTLTTCPDGEVWSRSTQVASKSWQSMTNCHTDCHHIHSQVPRPTLGTRLPNTGLILSP